MFNTLFRVRTAIIIDTMLKTFGVIDGPLTAGDITKRLLKPDAKLTADELAAAIDRVKEILGKLVKRDKETGVYKFQSVDARDTDGPKYTFNGVVAQHFRAALNDEVAVVATKKKQPKRLSKIVRSTTVPAKLKGRTLKECVAVFNNLIKEYGEDAVFRYLEFTTVTIGAARPETDKEYAKRLADEAKEKARAKARVEKKKQARIKKFEKEAKSLGFSVTKV